MRARDLVDEVFSKEGGSVAQMVRARLHHREGGGGGPEYASRLLQVDFVANETESG